MPWIYAESFESEIQRHVVSSAGFIRNVKFWHDLRLLDGVDVRLVSGGLAPHATFRVFQDFSSQVAGKPKIWLYGLLTAASEKLAHIEAMSISGKVISLVSLALRISLRANGDYRVLSVPETEYGWTPHFEDTDLKGIDVLQSPPNTVEGAREYEAQRSIPYHQPIVGAVTNDNYLSIYFEDVMRAIDGNTNVSVEFLHIGYAEFESGKEWLSKNNEEAGILLNSMPYYAAALSQQDPVLQFLLLWKAALPFRAA